jgi:hypothetical protein
MPDWICEPDIEDDGAKTGWPASACPAERCGSGEAFAPFGKRSEPPNTIGQKVVHLLTSSLTWQLERMQRI